MFVDLLAIQLVWGTVITCRLSIVFDCFPTIPYECASWLVIVAVTKMSLLLLLLPPLLLLLLVFFNWTAYILPSFVFVSCCCFLLFFFKLLIDFLCNLCIIIIMIISRKQKLFLHSFLKTTMLHTQLILVLSSFSVFSSLPFFLSSFLSTFRSLFPEGWSGVHPNDDGSNVLCFWLFLFVSSRW